MEILGILSIAAILAVWLYLIGIAIEALSLVNFAFRQPERMCYLLEHPEIGKEVSPFLDQPCALGQVSAEDEKQDK